MYSFLEENNLLQDKQFGFRSKHSTTHALISLTESIKNFLDKKDIVSGIFIDLEKGFDTANHSILCDKLNYYGFRGKFNDLIKSYLTNRKQFVSINPIFTWAGVKLPHPTSKRLLRNVKMGAAPKACAKFSLNQI